MHQKKKKVTNPDVDVHVDETRPRPELLTPCRLCASTAADGHGAYVSVQLCRTLSRCIFVRAAGACVGSARGRDCCTSWCIKKIKEMKKERKKKENNNNNLEPGVRRASGLSGVVSNRVRKMTWNEREWHRYPPQPLTSRVGDICSLKRLSETFPPFLT